MVERIVPKTPTLASREQKAIEDLRALFPDGNVAGLDGKDKALGKRLSKLYRALGYESRADMIAALGFRQESECRGGRPVTVDPEVLFAELQCRYEGKQKPTRVGILIHDNPDLSGTIKTVQNKCNELYGHTFAVELIKRGLLNRKMPTRVARLDDDAILDALRALEKKYASASTRPATVAALKIAEPEYAEALDGLTSKKCGELLGTTLARYLKAKGIIGTGVTTADDAAAVVEALDTLQELYRGKSNDDKPKTIASLFNAHPEHADVLTAGRKAKLVTRDILTKRGILGLSQAALRERAKVLKERCVRNAKVSELVRMYAGNGGAEVVLPDEQVNYLRPGVVGVDLTYRYELREVIVTALDAGLSVGDVLKPFYSASVGWTDKGHLELFKGETRIAHIERPDEDDFLTSKTYMDPTPLKKYEGAKVVGLETIAGRQLARIRYCFLSRIARETLLYALYRMGALNDAELYANDDSWRTRLAKLPEEPFQGNRAHTDVPAASSGSDAQTVADEQVVDLERSRPLPEEQRDYLPTECASYDSGDVVGAAREYLEAENPDSDEVPAVHEGHADDNGPEHVFGVEGGPSERVSGSDVWTFEYHRLAVGRRFSVEVPDQWVLTPDEGGRPLACYEKDVDNESEFPQIIYSALAGDLDEETQTALRENIIPVTRIQLSRKAIYGNDMANTLGRVVNDWVVDGRNCEVQVYEILMQPILPGFTSNSFEYHVKPVAYDNDDFLRLTDSSGHLGEGQIKKLAFSIASTVELDKVVELRRPMELEHYCVEPADANAFCELVGVISNMLNISGSERMNANLWREIRRSNNDKNCLLVAGKKQRIQAEAYNASLDDEVAYYGHLVTALERQCELDVEGFGKMWKRVGEFGDVRVVDHITMKDNEEVAKAVNSLGIISIPTAYKALHERWEALESTVASNAEKTANQTAGGVTQSREEEEAVHKAEVVAKREEEAEARRKEKEVSRAEEEKATHLVETEAVRNDEADTERGMQDARIELNNAQEQLTSLIRESEKIEAQIQEFDRQISDMRETAHILKCIEIDLDAVTNELNGLSFFAFGKKSELRNRIKQLEQSQREIQEKLPANVDESIKLIERKRNEIAVERSGVERRIAECRRRVDDSAAILADPSMKG